MRTKLFLYVAFGILLFVACQSDNNDEKEEPSEPEKVTFTIEPEAITLAVGESIEMGI